MNNIKLYPCGTSVTIKLSKVEGVITAQVIRFNNVRYEITYYIGGEQYIIFCAEEELIINNKIKKVGFKYEKL